jgi:hypothetical protein
VAYSCAEQGERIVVVHLHLESSAVTRCYPLPKESQGITAVLSLDPPHKLPSLAQCSDVSYWARLQRFLQRQWELVGTQQQRGPRLLLRSKA